MLRRPTSSTFGSAFAVLCAVTALVGCSDEKGGAEVTTTSSAEMSAPAPAQTDLPLVDQIGAAVTALETQLGGPQQYFEINATPKLVNLFVSLNNGAIAQPWVYLDGVLTSTEGQSATGGTFAASLLDFDPATVLAQIRAQVPGSTIESFYVNGDGKGHVQYGALITSAQGGGLDVQLGPDGTVQAVDPIN